MKNSIGAGLFSSAFGEDLGEFGNVKGIIDSSKLN